MTDKFAFIGDVHGSLEAVVGIVDVLERNGRPHLVFLGDYLNRGPDPAGVLGLLLGMQKEGRATLLAGNHENAFLRALDSSDLTAFLKMGGATTVRSYLGRPVAADVLDDLRANLPASHLAALRAMPSTWESEDVVAQHAPRAATGNKFSISAHVTVGLLPQITDREARIDTGAGSSDGRLTAFMWPSRSYMQVDAWGRTLHNDS